MQIPAAATLFQRQILNKRKQPQKQEVVQRESPTFFNKQEFKSNFTLAKTMIISTNDLARKYLPNMEEAWWKIKIQQYLDKWLLLNKRMTTKLIDSQQQSPVRCIWHWITKKSHLILNFVSSVQSPHPGVGFCECDEGFSFNTADGRCYRERTRWKNISYYPQIIFQPALLWRKPMAISAKCKYLVFLFFWNIFCRFKGLMFQITNI